MATVLYATLAVAQFPPPLRDAIPVSDRTYGAAPDMQSGAMGAAADGLALVVWRDQRAGSYLESYASRVDASGTVLDPLGIAIPRFVEAVAATPERFIVIGRTSVSSYKVIPVGRDGRVGESVDVALRSTYAYAATAVADDGKPRFLFVEFANALPRTRIAVVDSDGRAVASDVVLPSMFESADRGFTAAGRGSDFLVLRLLRNALDQFNHVVADRISADGNVLSSTDAGFRMYFDRNGLVGGGDGYLFVPAPNSLSPPAATAYHLDERGVFTGRTENIAVSDSDASLLHGSQVTWNLDRWILTWPVGPNSGHTVTYWAEVKPAGGATPPRRVRDWVGTVRASGVVNIGGQPFYLTTANRLYTSSNADTWIELLTPEGGTNLRLLSGSCTAQGSVSIASGANGYLAAWWENGPDGDVHLYSRRFSAAGEPQDDAPITLGQVPQDFYSMRTLSTILVSAGDRYLTAGNRTARRLDAASGSWIDPAPFDIGVAVSAAASNGAEVLAVGKGVARLVALHGDPLPNPVITLTTNEFVYRPAVASNGRDYLVVWSEGWRDCTFTCILPPFRLLAARVSKGGDLLDAQPIVIDDSGHYPDLPTVAWGGDHYVVAWSDGYDVRAARLGADGKVLDPSAVVIDSGTASGLPTLVGNGHRLSLLVRRDWMNTDRPQTITAVEFPADLPPANVLSLERTILDVAQTSTNGPVPSAFRGGVLAVLYDQISGSACGGVSRSVVQFFGKLEKRRAVRR